MMRTVLAVDELLAHAVRRELEGDVVTVDHMEMRDLGPRGALRRVRQLMIERRSVLVLGGRAWEDPLAFVEALRLQPFVPVILLLAAGQERPALGWRPRLYSTIPTEGGARLAGTIARQCVDAWAFAHSRLRPVVTHEVVRDEPRRPLREPARIHVLPLARSGE
jgi:hypothetical protein